MSPELRDVISDSAIEAAVKTIFPEAWGRFGGDEERVGLVVEMRDAILAFLDETDVTVEIRYPDALRETERRLISPWLPMEQETDHVA